MALPSVTVWKYRSSDSQRPEWWRAESGLVRRGNNVRREPQQGQRRPEAKQHPGPKRRERIRQRGDRRDSGMVFNKDFPTLVIA